MDKKRKVIEDLLDRNDIALFNDGSMTFHNVYNNQFSALDLSISSSSIHLDFHWSVNVYLNGSDHFPIHLRYAQNVPSESPPKWKVEEADWVKFSDGINLVRDFESFDSHLDAYDYFAESTLRSAQASIPRTRANRKDLLFPGGTRLVVFGGRLLGSVTDIINLVPLLRQNLYTNVRYYKKAKMESWLYYIHGINSKTPLSVVWRKGRKSKW